jgi:uncharacterized membrane protein
MKKIFIIFIFLFPLAAGAQTATSTENQLPVKVFSAEVINVLKIQDVKQEDGTSVKQQNLELLGLDGEYKNKKTELDGIGDPESVSKNIYQAGDKVSVEATDDGQGNIRYFITDYIRTDALAWLAVIFIISLLAVGRWKGLRALISLILTFLVVMEYILPQIIDGSDPVIVTMIGSLIILLIIIYITEGFNRNAHIAVISIFLSLAATMALSWFFVNMAKLSGLGNEEASFLVTYGGQIVNFQGLLLAGIIIGTLGVLDDVVISQITAVAEINRASAGQSRKEIFKKAMNIGVSHISAMTNTLFLAYAGASLPLLLLFLSGQSAFANPIDAMNNEALATEIVRTLAGSAGLVLSMPIATILAVWQVKRG